MEKCFLIVLVMAVTIETTNGIRSKHMTANVTQTLDYLLASSRYDKRLRPGFGGDDFLSRTFGCSPLWGIPSLLEYTVKINSAMDPELQPSSGNFIWQPGNRVVLTTALLSRVIYHRLKPLCSPATISVNFMIKSMGPVSENDQSFGLDCYFRQHWYDLRLRYQKFPGLEELSMSWLFLDRVWKPDTYFINEKRSYLHRITVPNKFLRLRHDGFITYSMRLTITASCPMHLRKFPLDAQRCPLVVGSFGYTNEDLIYKWTDETPIGLQPGVEIAQFDLVNITTEGEKDMAKGGLPHSTVQAIFWLKRHTGYFMLQVYVPCGLIVLSSWVSFWIDPDDVAARVALGVTTVLSLTTMGFGGRAQLPKVSYWTALDWFVIICFTSVFSVMIEYAIVNFIDKFKKDLKKIIQRRMEEEEEAKEREIAEMKARSKPISFKQKQRSASFSFPTSTSKEFQTTVQLEAISSHHSSLTTTVVAHFHPPVMKTGSKSTPNLRLTAAEEESLTTSTKSDSRHLIDMAEGTESIQVILDVQEDNIHQETEEDIEMEKKQTIRNFLKSIKYPKLFWLKLKMPERTGLMWFVEGSDPSGKFSRIDVQSRRSFPIAFFLSLMVYLFAYSYYLTDDIPVRDPDAGFYK